MPRGLNHVGVAGYNGKIYAIGGLAGGDVEAVASFYAYDVATDVWESSHLFRSRVARWP